MRKLLTTALILLALGLGFFLWKKLTPPRPNIILVVVDTMREDLGGANPPFFNSLKKKGIYFKNTYTTIPITLPAHLSMFTGKYPFQIGVINNGQKYKEDYQLLAERLKKKGYHTYAVVSLGTLQGFLGPSRGFDLYMDKFPKTRWYKTAEEVNQEVEKILPRLKPPFFLWIHYSDPHEPYAPPWLPPNGEVWVNGKKAGEVCFYKKEFFHVKGTPGEEVEVTVKLKGKPLKGVAYSVEIPSKREKIVLITGKGKGTGKAKIKLRIGEKGFVSIRPSVFLSTPWARFFYKREVLYWDSQFRKLYEKMAKSGLLKNTYLFILADHGEGLGEWKDHKGHIHFLNGVYTRIPLLILSPHGEKGLREEYRQITDIFPTLLHLASLRVPPQISGLDLLKDRQGHRQIFLETYAPESFFDRFSIIEGGFQLIHTPAKKKYFFFDAAQDPRTVNPIPFNSSVPSMMKALKSFEERAYSSIKVRPKRERKVLKVLRSLGYVK